MRRAFSICCYVHPAVPFLVGIIALLALSLPTLADDSSAQSLTDVDKSRQLLESDPDAWLKVVQTVESSSRTVTSSSSTSPSADAATQPGNTTTAGTSAPTAGGNDQSTPATNGPTLEETEKYIADHMPNKILLSFNNHNQNGFHYDELHEFHNQTISFNQDGSFDYTCTESSIAIVPTWEKNGSSLDSYGRINVRVSFEEIDATSFDVVSGTDKDEDGNANKTTYLLSFRFINAVPDKLFTGAPYGGKDASIPQDHINFIEEDEQFFDEDAGKESTDKIDKLTICFRDQDTANRVLKAFKHLLDLSGGGHKDPFAP